MAEQIFTTSLQVKGVIDPSVARVLGLTEKQITGLSKNMQMFVNNANLAGPALGKIHPSLQRATSQANMLGGSMRRVGEIVAGIGIGSVLVSGLQSALGLAKQLGEEFLRFAETSSKVAADYELMKKGLGNLLPGGLAQSNQIFQQEFAQAVRSPFQAKDLMQGVKRMVAAGANPNQAVNMERQIGDIVAGVGGGAPEMERANLAFGKIISGGRLTGQEGRELKDLGIPYEKTLEKIMGLDAEGLAKAQRKGQVTASVVQKMLDEMTGPKGLFFHSMDKFAETFRGLETSVADIVQNFQSQFGDLENAWIGLGFKSVGGSDVWNKVTDIMHVLGDMNQAVIKFVDSIPASSLTKSVQPYIDELRGTFNSAFNFVGSFFTTFNNPATGDIETILNPTGEAKIKEVFDGIAGLMKSVNDFVRNPDVQNLAGTGIQAANQAVYNIIDAVQQWAKLINDLIKGDMGAAWRDLTEGHTPDGFINPRSGEAAGWNMWAGQGYGSYGKMPKMATGGVIVGEGGFEAVMPMKNSDVLDNLNDTISKLNDILSGYGAFGIGGVGAGFGGALGGSGGSIKGSWLKYTEYGPAVDYVDAHGRVHGTPDSDSSRGIGHAGGRTFHLSNDSAAMHAAWARDHYHVSPGGWYRSDRDHQMHKYEDTSGARNQQNEDFYKSGDYSPTYNIYTMDASGMQRVLDEHGEKIQKHLDQIGKKYSSAKILA